MTTYDAGMAVPDWPTTYGYNMFLYPISTWVSGPWDLFIEHGHRLLGSLAGLVTIALNLAIWRFDDRPWMKTVGVTALLLVVSQGLLGGLRVRMNSTDFARAHGCTGPLFFATCVSICVMTSRFWRQSTTERFVSGLDRKSVLSGWMLVALAYLQLVLGAHLRHPGVTWSPMQFRGVVVFHVILAIVLLGMIIRISLSAMKLAKPFSRPAMMLLALIVAQVVLGVATWRAKYGWPTFLPIGAESSADKPFEISMRNLLAGQTVLSESMTQALTVTGHVAVGSLILATAVFYATRLSRAYACSGTLEQEPRSISSSNTLTSKASALLVPAGGSA